MSEDKSKLQGRVADVKIEDMVGAEWNPNVMNEKEFDRLTHELSDTGVLDPIQVVDRGDGKYDILGGHHRVAAAKVLGWETFPCVIIPQEKFKELSETHKVESDDLQKFINMRLNIIKGKISPDRFVKMYESLQKKYSDEAMQEMMGFVDTSAFEALLSDLKKDIEKSDLPDVIKDKFKETANELKTIDDISNILNFLFSKYGNTLDYGFMVLVYGGQEHIYVSLEDKIFKKRLKKLQDVCTEKGMNMEWFFKEALADKNIDELAAKFAANPPTKEEKPAEAAPAPAEPPAPTEPQA